MKDKPKPWQRRLVLRAHAERLRETREMLADLLSPGWMDELCLGDEREGEVRSNAENALDALNELESHGRLDSYAVRAGFALHHAASLIDAVVNSSRMGWFRGQLFAAACRIGEAGAWIAASSEAGRAGASGRQGRPADLDSRDEVRRKWEKLAMGGKAEHERASIIAKAMNVTPTAVRRHVRLLGLRKANLKGG